MAESEAAATAQGENEFGRGVHKKAKKKVTISSVSTTQALPTSRTIRHVMVVTHRVVMDSSTTAEPEDGVEGRMELDTHADTCVAGSNTEFLDLTGRVASVSPFCDSEYKALEDVPIATVTTAYDCAVTGKTYVLIFNEAHYFGDRMKHSLLCPNQLRANGLTVHDGPRQYDPTSTHSIVVPESELTIPLALREVISRFVTRVPSDNELADFYWDCRATVRKYTGRSPYCTLTYGTPNVSVYHTAHRAYGTRKLPDTQHRIYRYTWATNGHPIRREPIKGIAPNTASHFSPLQVRC